MKKRDDILKEKVSQDMQRKLNAIVLQAQACGIPSIMFGFRDGNGQTTIHFENMKINDAVSIAGMLWIHAIEMELNAHPEYEPEFKAILTNGIHDFKHMVKVINQQVVELRSKHPLENHE